MTIFLFALYALVYLMVSGSVSSGELLYAAGIAAAGTGMTIGVTRMADMNQRIRLAWVARLLKPSAAVVSEIWPLTRALVTALGRRRRVATEFSRRRFDPGASERAEDRGRRALVTLAISMTPASLVLERDVDCRELTIASVGITEPAAGDERWPI